MNKIILIITIFFLVGCNGQDKEDIKSENMRVKNFDITKFDLDRENQTIIYEGKKLTSESVEDITKEGFRTRDMLNDGYLEKIEPKDSFFGTYKEYYKNGAIKKYWTKDLVDYISGFAPWGIEYEFDENGKIIKETDYEKLYQNLQVNPVKLFEILDEKSILKKSNPIKYRVSIWFHSKDTKSSEMIWNKLKYVDGENPFWEVVRDYKIHDEEPANQKIYKVDAITGKINEIEK